MKLSQLILTALLGAALSSCCGDCDSTMIDPAFEHYLTGFKKNSRWSYVDTLHHDTALVSLTRLDKAVRVNKKKQFPVDCEECGIETAVVEFQGFGMMNDTSRKNYIYQFVLNALDNSLVWKNEQADAMFFASNISLHTQDSLVVHGKVYRDILALATTDCTTDTSLAYCRKLYPFFSKLYFARNVGLVRWEAKNHPLYGDAVFELYAQSVIR